MKDPIRRTMEQTVSMRTFFKDCLKELEAVTGLRQYTYLQIEAGKSKEQEAAVQKQVDILIESMVLVSLKFSYIPEEAQQRYIRQEMVEDQQYDSLSSRVVWKWLDRHKSSHTTTSQFSEIDLSQGKYYGELNPETKQLVDDFLKGLSGLQSHTFKGIENDMKQIEDGDRRRSERPKPSGYIPNHQLAIERELHHQWIRENIDPYTGKLKAYGLEETEWLKRQSKP